MPVRRAESPDLSGFVQADLSGHEIEHVKFRLLYSIPPSILLYYRYLVVGTAVQLCTQLYEMIFQWASILSDGYGSHIAYTTSTQALSGKFTMKNATKNKADMNY